jgi:hypothetical protein
LVHTEIVDLANFSVFKLQLLYANKHGRTQGLLNDHLVSPVKKIKVAPRLWHLAAMFPEGTGTKSLR